jgi:alginate O-acetyltransferase complex protein AlgJ
MLRDIYAPDGRFDVDLQELYRILGDAGVEVVDLLPVLQGAKQAGQQVFLRTDSHWSPHGLQLAAREVATRISCLWPDAIGRSSDEVGSSADDPALRQPYRLDVAGDMMRRHQGAPVDPEEVVVTPVAAGAGGAARAGEDRDSQIVVVADSHGLVFHAGGPAP